jgi:hypothetical protein
VVQLEAKYFPLVLLYLGGSGRTPEELRGALARFREVHQRAWTEGRRWILVAATDTLPDAVERKIIAEESNKFAKHDVAGCVATVLVISNSLIRSLVTAISWMTRNISPFAVAPTSSEAVDVAVERLRAAGIDCSPQEAQQARRWFRTHESTLELRAAGGGKGRR